MRLDRMKVKMKRRKKHNNTGRNCTLLVLLFGLIAFSMVRLIGYCGDYFSSQRTARELQDIYLSASDEPETPGSMTEEPIHFSPEPTIAPSIVMTPAVAEPFTSPLPPAQSPVPRLDSVQYPYNPKLEIPYRFRILRAENKDIVGWLTIGKLLDEPVVQRDNVFYMDHDAKQKNNVNGAIFLDSLVSLKTRPYTLILYGHNMKTGAMFGCLRNYENPVFYHNDPFITFDSLYEDGRYVIFSVGQISLKEGNKGYISFYDLISTNRETRREVIETLMDYSVYNCGVDVQPEDQLLVLVTCTAENENRRIVVARRIRENENEAELQIRVKESRLR